MNNYFGIGLDAQIAYQFHNAREKNQIKYAHVHVHACMYSTCIYIIATEFYGKYGEERKGNLRDQLLS